MATARILAPLLRRSGIAAAQPNFLVKSTSPTASMRLSAVVRNDTSGIQQPHAPTHALGLRKRVAVILSGCGVFDGSEVHEAAAVMASITRHRANVQVFAPDVPQMHALNHLNGEEHSETRNVLQEAARIARGNAQPLMDLVAKDYDALIVPGGFGAAKNLSNYATAGADCKLESQTKRVLREFNEAKKPIGLCCIAPVLAAKVFPGVTLTVGKSEDSPRWPYSGTTADIEAMGAKHVEKEVDEICIDEKFKIVTTPAFMCETDFHEVHDGVAKMVDEVLRMTD